MIYQVNHKVDNRELEQLNQSQKDFEKRIKIEMIRKMLEDDKFLETFHLEQFNDGQYTNFRILINI